MKNLLLFGGSSDIGESIINNVSNRNIFVTYNKGEVKQDCVNKIKCDITNKNDLDKVYESINNLDEIVFSAMPEFLQGVNDFTGYEESEKLLRGHIYALTQGLKKINEHGKIIMMSGQSADNGLPAAAYMGANMAYMNNIAKSHNSLSENIHMCDVQLGPVDTKMWNRVLPDNKTTYGGKESFMNPDDVAKYVSFILNQEVMPTKIILDNYYSLKK